MQKKIQQIKKIKKYKDASDINQENKKNLNERIEDLVLSLEESRKLNKKIHSLKFAFGRGILQGLGIIIGSTIVAGVLYSALVNFIDSETITRLTLDYIINQEK